MNNFTEKLDLSKLRNVKLVDNKDGKKCVLIPVDDNDIYVSERGSLYLTLNVREMRNPRYGQTHFIKQRVSKETYKNMTDSERSNIMICGQMSPEQQKGTGNYGYKQPEPNNIQTAQTNIQNNPMPSSDDLPF